MVTCADLVKNCTVVGHHKPALVLFVEPQADVAVSTSAEVSAFKEKLLKLIAPFNARLFSHERIEDKDHIIIAPAGSLARGGVSVYSPCVLRVVYVLTVAMTTGEIKYQTQGCRREEQRRAVEDIQYRDWGRSLVNRPVVRIAVPICIVVLSHSTKYFFAIHRV